MNFTTIKTFLLSSSLVLASSFLSRGYPRATIDMLEVPAKGGGSVIWSPIFQATWDELNKLHGGKPKKLDQENKLITALDSYKWNRDEVMPKGAYSMYAGPANEKFIKATEAAIKKKFGINIQVDDIPLSRSAKVAFGILVRELEFKKAFIESKNSALKFTDSLSNTHLVKFFGTAKKHSRRYRESLNVLSYKNKGKEFIISIATKTLDEKVIIYRPSAAMSMELAIKNVKRSIDLPMNGQYGKLDDAKLHGDDTVKIPYISLQSETDFTNQLQGLRLFEGDTTPWRVNVAKQFTQFSLDEKGAKTRVVSYAGNQAFGGPPELINRNFICDKPFYVFLWKDKAIIPYFALWVDSIDILKQFKNHDK